MYNTTISSEPDAEELNDEPLSVGEMITYIRAVEVSMADDPCLMDLLPELSSVRAELEERREMALEIANEIDAQNQRFKN